LTRCSDPANALRCMSLGVELLKVRGREAAEIAAKWAIRILELGLVGSVGHVLISERVASCFSAQIASPAHSWSSGKRKAALWNVITADEWMKLGRADLAADRLEDADFLYNGVTPTAGLDGFREMSGFLQQLGLAIRIKLSRGHESATFSAETGQPEQAVEEVTEHMSERRDSRSHRKSLVMGTNNPLGHAPLSPVQMMRSDPLSRGGDDYFE
jgi:trafficking protein particle complex subunit 8